MSLAFGNTAATPSVPNFQRINSAGQGDVQAFPTPPSTQINPGDLLLLNATTGQVALASNVAWDTNLSTTQGEAAAVLLGISMGQKNAADISTTPIPVLTRGYGEYPCAALGSQQNPGTYVSFAGQGTTNLADQQVATTATLANAIGKLSNIAMNGGTSLQFYFQSTLIHGAINAA